MIFPFIYHGFLWVSMGFLWDRRMTWVTRGRLVPRWRDIESSEQNPKIDAIGQLSDWVCLICVLLFDIWYIYIYIHIYNVCIYIYMYAIGHPPIAVVVVMVNFLNWNIHQPTDLCSFLAIVVETIFTLLNSPFPRVDSWVLQRSRLGKLPWSNTSATVKIWVSCVIISINGYLCTHL